MKILVAVKRVVDFNIKVRVKADGSGVDSAGLKTIMNPFDEIAVEEALQLKEAGKADEVVLVSIGPAAVIHTVRAGLAMGADRGLVVEAEGRVEPLAVAKALRAVIEREQPGLVLLGKQAIDDDSNQTGQMLAALCGWPQATFASKVALECKKVTVTREIDGGLETVEMDLPALITTDLRLNTPRFASLPNMMKARKKPVDTLTSQELGVDLGSRLTVLRVAEPPPRKGGRKVASVAELVDKLRNEAGVL